MHQVNLLDDQRSQIQLRMTRAAKHKQKSIEYLLDIQLATLCNVLNMYQRYMMKIWHTLEGCEDDLIHLGYDEDQAGVIVWGVA